MCKPKHAPRTSSTSHHTAILLRALTRPQALAPAAPGCKWKPVLHLILDCKHYHCTSHQQGQRADERRSGVFTRGHQAVGAERQHLRPMPWTGLLGRSAARQAAAAGLQCCHVAIIMCSLIIRHDVSNQRAGQACAEWAPPQDRPGQKGRRAPPGGTPSPTRTAAAACAWPGRRPVGSSWGVEGGRLSRRRKELEQQAVMQGEVIACVSKVHRAVVTCARTGRACGAGAGRIWGWA